MKPNRYAAVPILDDEIEELVGRAVEQNFVPVVDDRGAFVGMVRRKSIIQESAQSAGMLGARLRAARTRARRR